MATASGSGVTLSWRYDGNGNLLGTNTVSYSYTAAITPNEVLTTTNSAGVTTTYGYDQNGDTTGISSTSGVSTNLSYDSQARLDAVTLADGTLVLMTYNAQGQRVGYSVSKNGLTSESEQVTYRGDELAQAVISNTLRYTDTYLYDPTGAPLELLRQTKSGGSLSTARYWYVLNGHGDVVALTDVAGTVVDSYSYDLWGKLGSAVESVPQRLRYAGYWYDQELGWYWVSIRSYNPTLMRWLQPDPSQQDGVRTYVYVGDDPIDATDPTGMTRFTIWAAAFISPSTIHFLDPNRFDPSALVHGDARGFWNGSGPEPNRRGLTPNGHGSSRIWNEVSIDDDPNVPAVYSNQSGVGESEISWSNPTGQGVDYGFATNPAHAHVTRYTVHGDTHTVVEIYSHGSLPVISFAPDIVYHYYLDFDPQAGQLRVYGYHSSFPWHELVVKSGNQVISGTGGPWQYAPGPNKNPLNLATDTEYGVGWGTNWTTLPIPKAP